MPAHGVPLPRLEPPAVREVRELSRVPEVVRTVLAARGSLPVAPVERHRGVVDHAEALLYRHGEEDQGGYSLGQDARPPLYHQEYRAPIRKNM